MNQDEKLDLSKIHYEDSLAKYIKLAYRTLKKGSKKMPAESRMRIPLSIMFVIHNRDVFDYTSIKGFASVVKKVANISESSVNNRVLGGYIGGEYAGLRYIFYKYIPYRSNSAVSVMWYNRSKAWRYEFMVGIEERLASEMRREAEKYGEDISALRIE